MPTYVWNCATCEQDFEVFRSLADYRVPPEHPHALTRVLSACYGHGDITPYVATAGDMAGKPITSRQQHKAFLKRNKLVEFGTDPIKSTKNMRPIQRKPGEMAQDIKRAIHTHTVRDTKRGGLRER